MNISFDDTATRLHKSRKADFLVHQILKQGFLTPFSFSIFPSRCQQFAVKYLNVLKENMNSENGVCNLVCAQQRYVQFKKIYCYLYYLQCQNIVSNLTC